MQGRKFPRTDLDTSALTSDASLGFFSLYKTNENHIKSERFNNIT